jgi:hypothetical protein
MTPDLTALTVLKLVTSLQERYFLKMLILAIAYLLFLPPTLVLHKHESTRQVYTYLYLHASTYTAAVNKLIRTKPCSIPVIAYTPFLYTN